MIWEIFLLEKREDFMDGKKSLFFISVFGFIHERGFLMIHLILEYHTEIAGIAH